MTRLFPLFLLLAGCATVGPSDVTVETMQIDAKTYNLTPSVRLTGATTSLDLKTAYSDAVMARATEVCAPGGFDVVAMNTPDYVIIQLAPRYRIRCR